MRRFYANENLPRPMVEALRRWGHEVLTSQEAGQANQGIPDDAVLDFARDRDLIVITLNRDDFLGLHRSGRDHAGIVLCKDHRDYTGQMGALHRYLGNQPSLVNRLIRVKMRQQRGSNEPLFIIEEYTR